ncbi:hypothetical protein EYF80_027836 [Liparis tanakae]|uniref:Uncharacterized protein n=1 Tax=Liparis tanakae TaxID=230148 RepID=A0A4Z2H7W9_9TELE|nr:hypothetical protein EYF80_027836 [Liparis tanakae]
MFGVSSQFIRMFYQADASHAPLLICGVLQQPVVLCQVVHWVPVGTMDPGGSKLQSRFSYKKREERYTNVWKLKKRQIYLSTLLCSGRITPEFSQTFIV